LGSDDTGNDVLDDRHHLTVFLGVFVRKVDVVARRRRALAWVAISGALGALIALACGPGDLSDLTAGRANDAGDSAIADAAVPDAAPVCVHALPPERPTTNDSLNGPDVVFAFSGVRLDTGEEEAGLPKPLGLDLDDTCTCPQPESCVPPDSGMPRACDGPNGRDNAVGPLLAGVVTLGSGFGPEAAAAQIQAGDFGILVVVQGWNGLPDDPELIVGVLISSGVEGIQNDGGRVRPRFDGSDVWTVTPASVLGGADIVGKDCRTLGGKCLPFQSDPRAYVRGGVLVAHLDIPLPFETTAGIVQFDFLGATLSGTLTKDGAVYRLVGEIAGRWPIDNMLPTFARIHNPVTDTALCESEAGLQIYQYVKSAACAAVDLTTSPSLDNTGAPCDALSNAVSFAAVTATAGTVFQTSRTLPDDCPDFMDRCGN
jgi:hypothetical protein